MSARCSSCGRFILWARGPNGKPMPVDPDPLPDGNVLLYREQAGGLRAEVLGKGSPRPVNRNLRVSHFVTCPNAASHRKER